MTAAELAPDPSRYRANVGVTLFDRDGRVWLGRRVGAPGPNNWQFPQGGVDPGEDLEAAARRELREETGVRTVAYLGRTADWIAYDFPPHVLARTGTEGYLGQRQVWFAFRFEGSDAEIDLRAFPPVEFDAWRWAALDEALRRVAPFKRATYVQVTQAFRRFAEPD